jgi:hypothetical protein
MCSTNRDAYILHKLCIDDLVSVLTPEIHLQAFYMAFIAPDPCLLSLYETISTTHPTTHSRPWLPTKTSNNNTPNTSASTEATPKPPPKKTTSSYYYRNKYPIVQDKEGGAYTTMNGSMCWIYSLCFSSKCLSWLTPDLVSKVPHGIEFLSCEKDMDQFQQSKTLVFPSLQDNPWSYNINLAAHVKVTKRPVEPKDLESKTPIPRPLPCVVSTLLPRTSV